jgi:hypothetical protein
VEYRLNTEMTVRFDFRDQFTVILSDYKQYYESIQTNDTENTENGTNKRKAGEEEFAER